MQKDPLLEKYEEILEAVKRLEKAGTLKEFFESAPDLPPEKLYQTSCIPNIEEGFDKMNNYCLFAVAENLQRIDMESRFMKYYANYCEQTYRGYKEHEEEIKNPKILKFLKDYEEANDE